MYLDANNLYGWAMSQKPPINGFKWVEKSRLSRFNKRFIKMKIPIKDIFLKQMLSICKIQLILIRIYHFYREEKSIKQALNHGLILKKVRRVVKFNQRAWLKPYINMDTKLKKISKK